MPAGFERFMPSPRPRIRDGIRDALADVASICDEGARNQRLARHGDGSQIVNLTHASMDAEMLLERIADRVRRLRR